NRRAGGPARLDHDRDQHGRPRDRHQTRSGRQEVSGVRHQVARGAVRAAGREAGPEPREDQGAQVQRGPPVRPRYRRDGATRGTAHRPPGAQRLYALEGGEELKAEAQRMIDAAVEKLADSLIADYDDPGQWDRALIETEFLQKFMVSVPGVSDPAVVRNREELVRAAQQTGRE